MVQRANPLALHLLNAKRVSQALQEAAFRERMPQLALVTEVHVFSPKIMPEAARVVAVFGEGGGVHLVSGDQVFPLSTTVDAELRLMHLQRFGRVFDLESVRVVQRLAFFLGSSALPNPLYEMGIHGVDVQPWTGNLYRNTWNGMLSTFPAPNILARGGYIEERFTIQAGNRAEASQFARTPANALADTRN